MPKNSYRTVLTRGSGELRGSTNDVPVIAHKFCNRNPNFLTKFQTEILEQYRIIRIGLISKDGNMTESARNR